MREGLQRRAHCGVLHSAANKRERAILRRALGQEFQHAPEFARAVRA